MTKIELGQFFTKKSPFRNHVFKKWFNEAMSNSKNKIILEPFVGHEDIINMLKELFDFKYKGYDIEPKFKNTINQDTINNYPKGFDIAITNPPYLAKNSASRKGIMWKFDKFNDLYKVSLNEMLKNNKYVAAIVPATLLMSGLFRERLSDYISLNFNMFHDTNVPVCLALFKTKLSKNFNIWDLSCNNKIIYKGSYYTLKTKLDNILKKKRNVKIRFNDEKGKYGILATDKSYSSIKFVRGENIPDKKVKNSSRNIVRLSIEANITLTKLNNKLNEFFENNGELFLSPFKGLRNDKKYRRRLDFKTIRRIIEAC